MNTFIKFDSWGNIVELTQNLRDEMSGWLLVPSDTRLESHYVLNQEQVEAYTDQEMLAKGQPQLPGYQWRPSSMTWVLTTSTQTTQFAWNDIRWQRDQLLAESDWMEIRALSPGEPPVSSAWRTYRQSLRDITLQTDPYSIVWPTKPTV